MGEPSLLCLKTPDYFLAENRNILETMNDRRGAGGYPYPGSGENPNAMSDEWHRNAVEVAGTPMSPSEPVSMTNGCTGAMRERDR